MKLLDEMGDVIGPIGCLVFAFVWLILVFVFLEASGL